MPIAQCPMPIAPCPMPIAQCPTPPKGRRSLLEHGWSSLLHLGAK
ncbi:hypothetical protein [Fischerella sp.]|nr:hypothetical protein [Fischerella sp.]